MTHIQSRILEVEIIPLPDALFYIVGIQCFKKTITIVAKAFFLIETFFPSLEYLVRDYVHGNQEQVNMPYILLPSHKLLL